MSSDHDVVRFDHVSKRYTRGGRGGSLRDTIPQLATRLVPKLQRPRASNTPSRQFWALRDVSFEVRHGEALGIIGHNGAGKSTILKLLAGVTAPTAGRTRVAGRFAALIELGAGFHPDLTGRENIYLNGSILGLKRVEIDRKLESIIDFASLGPFIDTPVKRFSSGMQARLGFAVAAHVEPEALLIDEVLSVGDYTFQQKCIKRMHDFRRDGTAIVFVSHNLNAVASLCSKAILLQNGVIVAKGSPKDVINHYTTQEYSVISDSEASQVQNLEHGLVSHHMRIMDVEILDSHGRRSTSFFRGAVAIIRVRLQAFREIPQPIIGIGLRNDEGTIVYGTNTAMQGVDVGTVPTGEELIIRFSVRLHLGEGAYTINASALPLHDRVMLDWRENVARLEIFGDGRSIGAADLEASIRINDSHPVADSLLQEPGADVSGVLGAPPRDSIQERA